MKAAIYARCASSQGADMGIRTQLHDCRQYAANGNIDIVNEYIDVGCSGNETERPALQELMSAAEKHLFDIVIIHTKDRLSRSIFGYYEISGRLNESGVEIRSAQ